MWRSRCRFCIIYRTVHTCGASIIQAYTWTTGTGVRQALKRSWRNCSTSQVWRNTWHDQDAELPVWTLFTREQQSFMLRLYFSHKLRKSNCEISYVPMLQKCSFVTCLILIEDVHGWIQCSVTEKQTTGEKYSWLPDDVSQRCFVEWCGSCSRL